MTESYEQFLERRRIPDSWGGNWYRELVGVAYHHLVNEESLASVIRLLVDHYGIDLETARRAVEEARRALRLARGYA